MIKALTFYLLLAWLGASSLLWTVIAFVLWPLLPRAVGLKLGRRAISFIYRTMWTLSGATGLLRMDAGALDALREERGLILAANHPSMLDALMLAARLPRCACIMKADLTANIFLGTGARLARYIRNDSPRGMIRMAVADLKAGGQLVIFPEGTRTTQMPINPFRPGCTLIAKLAGAPIQTVFIDTDSPYLGKGWPLWRMPPFPIVFTARLGERFEPQRDSEALLDSLQSYFAAQVRPAPRAAVNATGRVAAGGAEQAGRVLRRSPPDSPA
jgi:1-acyl-sn-glycerol-3-phosphate acyltransferase